MGHSRVSAELLNQASKSELKTQSPDTRVSFRWRINYFRLVVEAQGSKD